MLQLAVVVAAISQKRSNLALGNILGSSISNILGAFALGLLFYPGQATFDRSSKMYAAVLLGITTLVAVFLAFYNTVKDIIGPLLIFAFVVYVLSIGYGIYRGVMSAPEDSDSDSESGSDSDSSSDSDSDADESDLESESTLHEPNHNTTHSYKQIKGERTSLDKPSSGKSSIELPVRKPSLTASQTPLTTRSKKPKASFKPNKRPKSLTHHSLRLLLGFIALTVSCYVLSHSISTIGDDLGLSNTLVGITFLSLATTLPEKFVAVIGGAKGQAGIVVANTAGSNIFLLTLCAGILFVSGDKAEMVVGFHLAEVAVMWLSAAILCACVFFGANRKIGAVIMGLYIAFLVAEFTIFND
jgi:Ca2+/Na+ antiporter